MLKLLLGLIVTIVPFVHPVLAEPINVLINQTAETNDSQRQATEYLKKLIEERSQGRLLVTLKIAVPDSSDNFINSLNRQQSQLILVDFAECEPWLPTLKVLELPFLFRDRQHLYRILDGDIGRKLFHTNRPLSFIPLGFWDSGFRQLATNVPMLTPKQVTGTDASALSEKSVVRFDVLLTELARGKSPQIHDLTLSNHILSGKLLVTSRSFWEGLPEDIKIIVNGAIKDATRYFRELAQQEDDQALRQLESREINIHPLTPAQRKLWQIEMQKQYPQMLKGTDPHVMESIIGSIRQTRFTGIAKVAIPMC